MNDSSTIVVSPRALTWDRPVEPATPRVLIAIGVAGLAGAIALPDRAAGFGFLVVAVVCAGCTWAAVGKVDLRHATWGTLSLALVGVTVMRDAYWLFVLCVLGACVAGSLAVAGGRSVGGLLLGAFTVPLAAMIALPWVVRGLNTLRRRVDKKSIRVGQSVLVSLVLLAVFVPLLAGADAAFAGILGTFSPTVDGDSLFRWLILFFLVGLGTAGALLAHTAPPDVGSRARSLTRVGGWNGRCRWGSWSRCSPVSRPSSSRLCSVAASMSSARRA